MKAPSIFLITLLCVGFAALGDEPTQESGELDFNYIKGRQKALDGKLSEAAPLFEKALVSAPENPLVNFRLCEVYMRLGQLEKAEGVCKKAVEKDPTNTDYRMTLGGVYAALKQLPEARTQYEKVQELEPGNGEVPLLLAILEAESGASSKAVDILSKSIGDSNDNFRALFYRAKIYLEMGEVDKAKVDLDKCLQLRPNFVEAGTALGIIQEKTGDIDGAIATYSRIQGSGEFKKRLAQLYLNKNDNEKALQALNDYEADQPDDYTARVKVGLILYEMKKFPEAADKFKSILKEQPKADNVRFYLGAVYEEQKQGDAAIKEFKKVGKDSSFFKEANLHVCYLYKESNKLNDGLKFAKTLTEKYPDQPEYYDVYASFHEGKKDYKQAMAVVAKGLKKFPEDERLLYFEGALYDKMGDKRRGIENMRKILTLNENHAHALNFLGYTYAEMGENLDEAEKLVERALKLRPNDGYIEDSLGWVLYKKGNIDGAVAKLEKAATLQPQEPVIYEHLGDVYTHKKEFEKAVGNYEKAISLVAKKDKDLAKKLAGKMAVAKKSETAEVRLPSNKD